MEKTRILLAEDHKVVREGTRRLLESQADFEVVGEASDGIEAVELAKKLIDYLVSHGLKYVSIYAERETAAA
jgi:DNA-binding NarL/FixJ family response regulator